MGDYDLAFSRRANSASMASRMNCARLFGPASASMRDITASESRTCVAFTPNAGRPIRGVVSDTASCDKPIPPIDLVSDTGFISVIGYGDKSMCLSFKPIKLETVVVMRGEKVAGRINRYRSHGGCVVSVPGVIHPTETPGQCWFPNVPAAKAALLARSACQ